MVNKGQMSVKLGLVRNYGATFKCEGGKWPKMDPSSPHRVGLHMQSTGQQFLLVRIDLCFNPQSHLFMYETLDAHAFRVQPPNGEDRVSELGQWKQREFKVSGISWEVNSVDIAIAGFGWFSLGLKGEATLMVWTYEGVETVLREPLVLDRAPFLERPGFLLPKAISDAIGNQSKLEEQMKKQEAEKS